MSTMDVKVEAVVEIAKAAGVAIMDVYEREYEIIEKADGSPVTTADHRAHDIIVAQLRVLTPEILVVSEESKDIDDSERLKADRVWMVDHLATRWGGPVAIAVYVDDGKALRRYRRQLERLRERGDSSVVKVARPPGGGGAYPINRLRNIALREVRTTHLLLTDIDLWPSTNARSAALALSGPRYLAQPHLALVLPAFEYQGGSDGKDASPSELPESFGELESCMGANGNRARCAIFKHATDTHLTTDYDRWWAQDEPAPVVCFRSLRYEPYLVVPRLN